MLLCNEWILRKKEVDLMTAEFFKKVYSEKCHFAYECCIGLLLLFYFLFTEMSIYVTKTGMFLINRKILPCKCKTKQSRTSKECLKTRFINYTSVELSSNKITGKPFSNVHWDTRVRSSSWSYSGFILFWNQKCSQWRETKAKTSSPAKTKRSFSTCRKFRVQNTLTFPWSKRPK